MNEKLKKQVQFAKARTRNILYYWGLEQEDVFRATRKQYIHILREHRKDVSNLVELLKADDPVGFKEDIAHFENIAKIIDPKVRSNDCGDTIERIENYLATGKVEVFVPREKPVNPNQKGKKKPPFEKSSQGVQRHEKKKPLGGIAINELMRQKKNVK